MKKIEINLLDLHEQPVSSQFTREHRVSGVLPLLSKLIVFGAVALVSTAAFSYQQAQAPDSTLNKTFNALVMGGLPRFGEHSDRILDGQTEDRINILLLGIGGEQHDGGQLSDTNIILSVKPSTKQVALISIPRDLVVPIEGYGWRKINEVNAWGEREQHGSGPQKTADTFAKILGVPIQYFVRADFQAFSDIVDIVGGVTVTVDRSFTDYSYPTLDYKYQTVSFNEGAQTMNGATALKFVRSRHSGMNNEGSDFARSRRQQKVIAALKEKLLSSGMLLNPKKLTEIIGTIKEHVATNITPWQGLELLLLAKDTTDDSIIRLVFDDSPDNYLTSDWQEGVAYMLRPKDGTYEGMQKAVTALFDEKILSPGDAIKAEAPTVIIKNGTAVSGLATKYASTLSGLGFRVIGYSNARERTRLETALYATGSAKKEVSTSALEQLLGAVASNSGWDSADLATGASAPDFLVVLGSKSASALGSK